MFYARQALVTIVRRNRISRTLCASNLYTPTVLKHFTYSKARNQCCPCIKLKGDSPPHVKIIFPKYIPFNCDSGTTVSWLKKEGDNISAQELLAVVELAGIPMDVVAYENGYLGKIFVPVNHKVYAGELICITVTFEKDVGAFKDFKPVKDYYHDVA